MCLFSAIRSSWYEKVISKASSSFSDDFCVILIDGLRGF